MKLKTTPAMRARCRELIRQGGTDDYDSVVDMLLDDFDLMLASIGQSALQPQPSADDAALLYEFESALGRNSRDDIPVARAAVLARMSGQGWLRLETLEHQHVSDEPLTVNGKVVPATYTSDPVILTNGKRVWVERSVIMGGALSASADKFTAYPSGDKPTHWQPLPAAPTEVK